MSNEYYDSTGYPGTGADGDSASARAEFDAIQAGFALLPTLTGNGGKVVRINSGGTSLEASAALDLTTLTVSSTLTVGATASITTGTNAIFQVLTGNALIASYSTTAATNPTLVLARARGTAASPTALTSGDDMGSIGAYGYVGATGGWVLGARILFDNVGAVSDTSTGLGCRIIFQTRTAGSGFSTILTLAADNTATFASDLTVTDDLFVVGHGTTASAANAFLDSGTGELLRSTSSERYKRDFEIVQRDRARDIILNSRAFTYRSNLDLCPSDAEDRRWFGFGAGQVATVDPELVDFNERGDPERVQYERYVVPLTVLVADHEQRIAALEAR